MLPRSCILMKQIYQSTPKSSEYRQYCILRKQLHLLLRSNNILQHNANRIKPSVRTIIWSHVLLSSKDTKKSVEVLTTVKSSKPNQNKNEQSILGDINDRKVGVGSNTSISKTDLPNAVLKDSVIKQVLHEKLEKNFRNENKSDSPKGPEQKMPVLQVKVPPVEDGTTTDKGKEKVNLENIKEQSLGKPKTATISAEPLQKLKDKILELKKDDVKSAKVEQPAKPSPKKRKRVDLSASSLERNFITPVKAMSDFLLKPSDLESLPKTKRRSPYECEPPITVYWRKDVEAKALEVWGSKENLLKEQLKRNLERKKYQQSIFTVKRRLRDYRRELGRTTDMEEAEEGLMGRSGKVVVTAIAINATNCLFKLFAWIYTGSHSMFSECIHSLADTINQIILAYGIHKSIQIADSYHPYGYTNMKYVASLISGVGIFCVGTGLSFYHGVTGLISAQPVEDFFWAYCILGGSLFTEGATCLVALNSVRKGARTAKMSVRDYITRGQDPSVNVVLLEDFAAVVGVLVAGSCMGLSSLTHSPIPDAVGSLLVGCILGSVASFIIYTNVAALVGRSIPQEHLDRINSVLETDVMVRAIHDVKGIDMGNFLVRYKAELDFDGRELTRMYLDKQELNALLEEVKKLENIDQLEEFILKHGESIVDMMGGEIDRIELKLRKNHPEIRHCDLEIL